MKHLVSLFMLALLCGVSAQESEPDGLGGIYEEALNRLERLGQESWFLSPSIFDRNFFLDHESRLKGVKYYLILSGHDGCADSRSEWKVDCESGVAQAAVAALAAENARRLYRMRKVRKCLRLRAAYMIPCFPCDPCDSRLFLYAKILCYQQQIRLRNRYMRNNCDDVLGYKTGRRDHTNKIAKRRDQLRNCRDILANK